MDRREHHPVSELDVRSRFYTRDGMGSGLLVLERPGEVDPVQIGRDRQDVVVLVLNVEAVKHRQHRNAAVRHVGERLHEPEPLLELGVDLAYPCLDGLVPLLLVVTDRERDALGSSWLPVVEVRHSPRHSVERTSEVVQGVAEVERPFVLRYPARDSRHQVDSPAVRTQHGVHLHGRAGVPLAELGLHDSGVRASATPLEVGPRREVDTAHQLDRLCKRWLMFDFGSVIRHGPSTAAC